MPFDWRWRFQCWSKNIGFRATLFSLLGVITALLSLGLGHYLPESWAISIGSESVDKILAILSSSMLAITTFSLSIMVSAFGLASTSITPRAAQLIIHDGTAQSVLSTFMGAFLFSLVSIIAQSTGVYDHENRLLLFIVTVVVMMVVVATLLRWVNYLSRFGQLDDTSDRLEETAKAALIHRRLFPWLGAQPLPDHIPTDAVSLVGDKTGYIRSINIQALGRFANQLQLRIYVNVLPGDFVDPTTPLAQVQGLHKHHIAQLLPCFDIGNCRSYDMDPCFGLEVMAEVALRALATNDAGTANGIIGRGVRLLAHYAESQTNNSPFYPNCEHVYVKPLPVETLISVLYEPITLVAAGNIQVMLPLQDAMGRLIKIDPQLYRRAAILHSDEALMRAELADMPDTDLARIKQLRASFIKNEY